MMKKYLYLIIAINIFTFNSVLAQTADEIISSYVEAIGGKEHLGKITSLYIESKSEIGGNEMVIKTTFLNGKGYREEMDFGNDALVTCYNQDGGWSINPSTGSDNARTMSAEQYHLGKDKIFIGAPFVKYKESGYQAEFLGNEMIGSTSAFKIKLTSPENVQSIHFFDTSTGYLIKTVKQDDMLGQMMESIILYSDYRQTNGYTLPYKTTAKLGGMLEIPSMVTKVEVNNPLDANFFVKPLGHSASIEGKTESISKESMLEYKSLYKETVPVCNCEDLVKIKIPNTKIESAVIDPNDSSCRVTAIVTHPPFNDKVKVTIALPLKNWNGRFLGYGGGGFAAGVLFALNEPVSQGFAAGVTDGGHTGWSGSFAFDQEETRLNWQSIRDFAHIAIHDMTVVGKELVKAFYGNPAKYSYFLGGSTGGRQAMSEVQRYPEDYDGVVAHYPAIYYSQILLGFLWPQVVMSEENTYVSKQKLNAVTEAVIAACDGDDGLIDGVINDPINCEWDPGEFVGTQVGDEVFTKSDADVVRKIWKGPRGYDDKFLWYGLTRGSNLLAYADTKGDPLTGKPNNMALEWVQYFLLNDPDWDGTTLTYTEFESLFNQGVEQYFYLYETADTDLSRFRDHGSKLIMTHGLADNAIPPQGTIKYYKLLQESMGGARATSKFARLFLFPGLDHSFSGPGAKPVDLLGAVMRWVEEGKAPKYIDAEIRNDSEEVIRKTSIYTFK